MSENRYLVAARKYRPQRFGEIVAQQHVTETLQNAIRLDRLAHAYLFSGPRGVGKTTAARILAKAINCTTALEERELGEPCRQCESCITFEQSRSLSILEIDAASNNRVEDIRELRDTILIPPQGSKKKVYIIDEVHMLSNAAFNALLKTLEEPPPHALFIFATTEPNKVLPTILSRCQRFDFRRIAVPEIIKHLKAICEEENIQADEASLMLIAHKGDGALRDSLSAFDQAVSLCGTSLMYDELAKAFGVVGIDLFFEVTDYVRSGNSAGLLTVVDRILSQGYDLQEFLVGLANHLRNFVVAVTMPDTSLIEAAESVKKNYAEAAGHFTEPDLLRLLMITADGEQLLKTSVQPRLQLELSLLKMASMAHAVDLRQALKKLDELEKHVQNAPSAGSNPSAKSPASNPSSAAAPVATSSAPRSPDASADASSPSAMISEAASSEVMSSEATPPAAAVEPVMHVEAVPSDSITTEPVVIEPLVGESHTTEPHTPEPQTTGSHTPEPQTTGSHTPEPHPSVPTPLSNVALAPEVFTAEPEAPVMELVAPAPEEIEEDPEEAPRMPVDPQQSSLFPTAPSPAETPPSAPAKTSNGEIERFFGTPALKKVSRPSNGGGEPAVALQEVAAVVEGPPVEEVEWIKGNWEAYSKKIKQDKIHVSALLQHTAPLDIRDATLVLSVPDEFHKRMLGSQSEYLLTVLKEFVSIDAHRISFVVDLAKAEEKAAAETAKEIDPYEYMQKKRQENPVIKAIFDEFGGEMVW